MRDQRLTFSMHKNRQNPFYPWISVCFRRERRLRATRANIQWKLISCWKCLVYPILAPIFLHQFYWRLLSFKFKSFALCGDSHHTPHKRFNEANLLCAPCAFLFFNFIIFFPYTCSGSRHYSRYFCIRNVCSSVAQVNISIQLTARIGCDHITSVGM